MSLSDIPLRYLRTKRESVQRRRFSNPSSRVMRIKIRVNKKLRAVYILYSKSFEKLRRRKTLLRSVVCAAAARQDTNLDTLNLLPGECKAKRSSTSHSKVFSLFHVYILLDFVDNDLFELYEKLCKSSRFTRSAAAPSFNFAVHYTEFVNLMGLPSSCQHRSN